MTYRFCHRCQAEIPKHDDGTLVYCAECGAPQVQLSEELKEQLAEQAEGVDSDAPMAPAGREGGLQVWPTALRCVGLAAAIAAGLGIGSALLPPVLLLAWLWAVSSPVIVLGIFQAKSPMAPVNAGFGARLGLLTGLAVGLVLTSINTIELLVLRHAHQMADFDTRMAAAVDQLRIQAATEPGAGAFVQALSLPEFRAGMVLGGFALMTAILLVVTTAGGAFAGFVRSRSRA